MSSRVVVALRVNAPQAKAFEVFVRDIGAWWRPNGLFRTAAKPGTLAFHGLSVADAETSLPESPTTSGPIRLVETAPDGESFEIGRVSVYLPPERLVFSWRQVEFPPELTTEVEVRFEVVSDAVTRVSVEHRGFHRVPEDSAARHGFPDAALQMRLAEWWHALLDRYRHRMF